MIDHFRTDLVFYFYLLSGRIYGRAKGQIKSNNGAAESNGAPGDPDINAAMTSDLWSSVCRHHVISILRQSVRERSEKSEKKQQTEGGEKERKRCCFTGF